MQRARAVALRYVTAASERDLLPGAWVVRAVHMQRSEGCSDVQWESFWTAYSFAVRG